MGSNPTGPVQESGCMKRILEISDSDVGFQPMEKTERPRTAARAILRRKGLVALLRVSKHNYYKLPGGGLEEGESVQEGLEREVLEEVGCSIRVKGEVGESVEHRTHIGVVQTSNCFLAEAMKEGKPRFMDDEVADGFRLLWVSLDEAIRLVGNSKPDTYDGRFIVKRDLEFLKAAKRLRRS